MNSLFNLSDKLMEAQAVRLGVPIKRRYSDLELVEAGRFLQDAEEDFEAEQLREEERAIEAAESAWWREHHG